MTQILLIRHATNDWVGSQRLAGRDPGVHLNAKGRAEASALAARLAGHRIDAVYASPLERTLETAHWISASHGLDLQTLPGVLEIDFGKWQGQSLETLRKDPLWAGVQHRPSITRFPDGETLAEAQSRAVAAIEALRVAHEGGVVAVVSHADIIKAVLAYYAGIHIDLFQRIDVSPASVSVLRFAAWGPMIQAVNLCGQIPSAPAPETQSDAETTDSETKADSPEPEGSVSPIPANTDAT